MTGGPWSHLEKWQIAECRSWHQRLAEQRTLVRYDGRGMGLSQRDVADYSLEAHLRDLETTLRSLELETFDLMAGLDAGPVAITYAARNPERVSRLVLWCSWAAASQMDSPRIRAWQALVDEDWELMTDTCAHLVVGWSAGEVGRQAAELLRQTVTPEAAKAMLSAFPDHDAAEHLPSVRAPTLVLHQRDVPWLPVSIAQDLASGIEGARLMLFDGESTAPYLGNIEAVLAAIEDFLEGGPAAEHRHPHDDSPPKKTELPDDLTEREVEVLRLLAAGSSNKQIAPELYLSVRTVERHVANIYGKIGASGRANATAYALSHDLV